MPKGKKIKGVHNPRAFSLFLLLAFLASLLLLTLELQVKEPVTNAKVIAYQITHTPTPTPTPPLTIPLQFGYSIKLPILTYHYIGNNPNPEDLARDNLSVNPVDFEAQMEYLSKNGYKSISLDTAYQTLIGNSPLSEKAVVLTFDDAYIDFYHNAYPILKRFNLSATVFAPTGLIDQGYYMSWNQIKEIDQGGLISVQSHSVNHSNLAASSYEQLQIEIKASKQVLEQELGKSVNWFAYPYGISNQTVWDEVKKAGYIGAVGTWSPNIVSEGVILNMPRIKVSGNISLENFASIIN